MARLSNKAGLFILCSATIFLQAFLFSRFPPSNFDEVENAVLSVTYNQTGEILYPLMRDVIHPDFFDLSQASQNGYRGIYIWLLSRAQKIVGTGFLPQRAVSMFVWVLAGTLLAGYAKKMSNTSAALITLALWAGSLNGLMASHLIRPDIWLTLIVIVQLCLLSSETPSWSVWIAIGMLGPFAAGLHPHGILVIVWGVLAWVRKYYALRRREIFMGFLMGFFVGAVCYLMTMDLASSTLATSTYQWQIYIQASRVWFQRLLPWNLLMDTLMMMAKPDTFYVHETLRLPIIWNWSTAGFFTAILISLALHSKHDQKAWIRSQDFFGLFIFIFGIGFGYIRREILYTLPVIALAIPFIAGTLADTFSKRNRILSYVLLATVATTVFSGISQAIFIRSHTPSLPDTFSQTRSLLGQEPRFVLAPPIYWFSFQNKFRDIHGLVADYYYSFQYRLADALERTNPDVVITDDEVRRRFRSLDEFLTKYGERIGTIPANPNHSELHLFRIRSPHSKNDD